MVQKIDLAKYIIIYHYGGVYIDMDMDCVKDLTKLINPKNLIIYEGLHPFYLSKQRNIYDLKVFLSPQSELAKKWKVLYFVQPLSMGAFVLPRINSNKSTISL